MRSPATSQTPYLESEMTIQTTKDAMLALMRFGAACLSEHREYISDLDGDWLQERAIEVGLLEAREMNEPCGPDCECEAFPTECLFPRSGVSRLLGGDNLINAWHELCAQHDAALKLADLWEAQAIKYPLENATSLVSPYTAEAVAVAQAAVKACAKELRAIYADKEQA